MVRILRPEWTNPIPIDRRLVGNESFIQVEATNVYYYPQPGENVEVALHEHVEGYPPPAVRSVQDLPAWAMQDGTFITGTLPDDETETQSFDVEMEN